MAKKESVPLCCFCDMPFDEFDHDRCGIFLIQSHNAYALKLAQEKRQVARKAKMAEKNAKKK